MKRAPFVDDYAGNAYGSRRRTRKSKANHHSYKCRECGTLCYLTQRELLRAARPKCMKCGGTLVESSAEEKRHRDDRRSVVFTDSTRAYRCRACGQNMGSFNANALSAHLMLHPHCVHYMRAEGYVVKGTNDRAELVEFIYGTLELERANFGGRKWLVRGISPTGKLITIRSFQVQYTAREYIAAACRPLEEVRDNPVTVFS